MNTVDAAVAALKSNGNQPMNSAAVAELAKTLGWVSEAKDPSKAIGSALNKNAKFASAGKGLYVLADANIAMPETAKPEQAPPKPEVPESANEASEAPEVANETPEAPVVANETPEISNEVPVADASDASDASDNDADADVSSESDNASDAEVSSDASDVSDVSDASSNDDAIDAADAAHEAALEQAVDAINSGNLPGNEPVEFDEEAIVEAGKGIVDTHGPESLTVTVEQGRIAFVNEEGSIYGTNHYDHEDLQTFAPYINKVVGRYIADQS